jgi:phage shock protein PspC (stress-responsive transcriptional regulator)
MTNQTYTSSASPTAQSWQLSGLARPRNDRLVAGVCSGIAHRYGLSATTVRLLFLLSLLLPGPQVLVYVALWVLIPDEPWQGMMPPTTRGGVHDADLGDGAGQQAG